MTDQSELKSPFVGFDYNDDTNHSSRFKQGILYMVRMQGVLNQIGQLELAPEVVSFVREPHIRSKLEDIIKGESKFSLTSPELPFLMRAELVDAYFQYKISQHLQGFDEMEIYFTQGQRELFAKPVGTEVTERLGRDVDEGVKQQIRQALAAGTNLDIYDAVFDGTFRTPDIAAAFHHEAGSQVTSALVPHVSSELVVSHLGGREAISSTLFFHALFMSRPATEKEKAIYCDGMRRILQVDGGLPTTLRYNGIKLSLERYNEIPPGYRRVIHNHLMSNFMDAQKIQEVAIIFPGEIDISLAQVCIIGGFLEAGNRGVRMDGSKFYFDNDPSKDLEKIAMGAQYLLQKLAEGSETALVTLDTQTASDQRRARHNVSFFSMIAEETRRQAYCEGELDEITASNAFEFWGIDDPRKQQEFYNAYRRLFGEEGYEGGTGQEVWVKARMKLMPDGKMQMAIVDEMYGDKEKIDWFDPFEYAKSDERGVEYFREDDFDPNMERLKKILDNEIVANERVKQQLTLATGRKCPVRVDEGLYYQMQFLRETIDELAKWDERIVVLLPFVEQDYTAYMEMLGIDELTDRNQVTKAYHRAIIRDEAHPDKTQDPAEKIERGRRLNELIRARDELVHKLDLQSVSSAYGVSMYIGNTSAMLRHNQSPAQ